MQEALLYKQLPHSRVRCHLCAHRCVIDKGHLGLCQVRENRGGTLYTLVYGRTISQAVDPIEKKPLYHFHPGSLAFSIATPGCNFRCAWCQNWEISQRPRVGDLLTGLQATPDQLAATARRQGCRSIAYTYTEPVVFFEYARDIAVAARREGLANIFVSNGYMTKETLDLARDWLDAVNIDLKAFRDSTYRRYVGARLQPVLDSLRRIREYGIWLEVTTLIIPGVNDDATELKELATFIARQLGPETPWHISRFFPCYRMQQTPPTSLETLQRAETIGREAGLVHIYQGNTGQDEDTVCSRCGLSLIGRRGFAVTTNRIRPDSTCPDCGAPLAGIGMAE